MVIAVNLLMQILFLGIFKANLLNIRVFASQNIFLLSLLT